MPTPQPKLMQLKLSKRVVMTLSIKDQQHYFTLLWFHLIEVSSYSSVLCPGNDSHLNLLCRKHRISCILWAIQENNQRHVAIAHWFMISIGPIFLHAKLPSKYKTRRQVHTSSRWIRKIKVSFVEISWNKWESSKSFFDNACHQAYKSYYVQIFH